ncbi:hypothetical protein HZ326_1195 [Fusarium oxysporum f. sp. albedinis]|nr:hypothetical protein HZ326_1195 [Fusarium oxysporum f. sp. albedinis]
MHITHHLETAREDQLAFPQVSVNYDVALLRRDNCSVLPGAELVQGMLTGYQLRCGPDRLYHLKVDMACE